MKTRPGLRIRLEPFRASWRRWLSLVTGVVLFRVLENSIPLPGTAAVGTGLWLLAHTAWTTRTLPARRRWLRALAVAVIANVLATIVRVGWVVVRHGSVDIAYAFTIGLPGVAWFLPFTAAGALLSTVLDQNNLVRTAVRIAMVLVAVYAATFLIAFDIRSGETHPFVEHADKRGRSPVVGPRVSPVGLSICPGEGPCFLWSCDHTGDEWLFRFHRPLVDLWFRAQAGRYVNPDLEG
ncbi:MAG: hypothetical protein ACOVT5_09995 [Armatimonadaceae bacterium]